MHNTLRTAEGRDLTQFINNTMHLSKYMKGKRLSNPITGLDRHRWFQEAEALTPKEIFLVLISVRG